MTATNDCDASLFYPYRAMTFARKLPTLSSYFEGAKSKTTPSESPPLPPSFWSSCLIVPNHMLKMASTRCFSANHALDTLRRWLGSHACVSLVHLALPAQDFNGTM